MIGKTNASAGSIKSFKIKGYADNVNIGYSASSTSTTNRIATEKAYSFVGANIPSNLYITSEESALTYSESESSKCIVITADKSSVINKILTNPNSGSIDLENGSYTIALACIVGNYDSYPSYVDIDFTLENGSITPSNKIWNVYRPFSTTNLTFSFKIISLFKNS